MPLSYENPIQHQIQSDNVVRLFAPWPYNYYTCIREITDYKKTDWYCIKGRYEFVYSEPCDFGIEYQTLRFCKFRKNKELLIADALNTDKVIIT